MCEISCRVVNNLAIYSEVHGYKYTLFVHRPPIMTRTSLIIFRHFRQIKKKTYLKLGHCCVLLHFFSNILSHRHYIYRSQLGLSYWQRCLVITELLTTGWLNEGMSEWTIKHAQKRLCCKYYTLDPNIWKSVAKDKIIAPYHRHNRKTA
jgi:hypothetical protein